MLRVFCACALTTVGLFGVLAGVDACDDTPPRIAPRPKLPDCRGFNEQFAMSFEVEPLANPDPPNPPPGAMDASTDADASTNGDASTDEDASTDKDASTDEDASDSIPPSPPPSPSDTKLVHIRLETKPGNDVSLANVGVTLEGLYGAALLHARALGTRVLELDVAGSVSMTLVLANAFPCKGRLQEVEIKINLGTTNKPTSVIVRIQDQPNTNVPVSP